MYREGLCRVVRRRPALPTEAETSDQHFLDFDLLAQSLKLLHERFELRVLQLSFENLEINLFTEPLKQTTPFAQQISTLCHEDSNSPGLRKPQSGVSNGRSDSLDDTRFLLIFGGFFHFGDFGGGRHFSQ